MKKEREIWRNRFFREKPSLLVNRGTKKPLFSHCEETGGFYAYVLLHCRPGHGSCRAHRHRPRSGHCAAVRRCPGRACPYKPRSAVWEMRARAHAGDRAKLTDDLGAELCCGRWPSPLPSWRPAASPAAPHQLCLSWGRREDVLLLIVRCQDEDEVLTCSSHAYWGRREDVLHGYYSPLADGFGREKQGKKGQYLLEPVHCMR